MYVQGITLIFKVTINLQTILGNSSHLSFVSSTVTQFSISIKVSSFLLTTPYLYYKDEDIKKSTLSAVYNKSVDIHSIDKVIYAIKVRPKQVQVPTHHKIFNTKGPNI